jgi:hypothetical protein
LIDESLVELKTIYGVPSKFDGPVLNSGFATSAFMLGLFGPLAAIPGLIIGGVMAQENMKSQLIELPSILLTNKGKAIAQIKFGS